MSESISTRLGWLRDFPDHRDFTPTKEDVSKFARKTGEDRSIKSMVEAIGLEKSAGSLAESVDLSEHFSPVEDQKNIGSCTANAGVGLIEYYERRAFGRYLDASRLFLYKTTRNLLNWTGDTGAFLRTTMASMRLFGVLPESYWPYNTNNYDDEPPAFCYAFAQNFQAIQFFRLDSDKTAPKDVINRIKQYLAAGIPSMFGFSVYSSIQQANDDGAIPFPVPTDRQEGGHAVVACGYDDKKKIKNNSRGGQETVGAFKIRNSWGTSWGEDGYGYLPYQYVLSQLAVDWWSVLKSEWVDTRQFGL